MKINGAKIKEIKQRIKNFEEYSSHSELLSDLELTLGVIEEIRESVHYAENAEDFCLDVAEKLGTNCSPDKDIDNE